MFALRGTVPSRSVVYFAMFIVLSEVFSEDFISAFVVSKTDCSQLNVRMKSNVCKCFCAEAPEFEAQL